VHLGPSCASATIGAVWTSLASGVIGALVVALIFYGTRIPGDVAEHDRLITERDEDLSSWVADRHTELERAHRKAIKKMAPVGLLWSSERHYQLSMLNEAALHEWRDEERAAARFRAALLARETFAHRWWRHLLGGVTPELSGVTRADPILDQWVTVRDSDGNQITVDDPRARSPESVTTLDLGKASPPPPERER
jgi:hypothetical protein